MTTANQIPEEFKITTLKHQKHYLVNGKLEEWNGETSEVISTISSTEEYKHTVLGSIPTMGEKEAMKALDAALSAYDQGQGFGLQ